MFVYVGGNSYFSAQLGKLEHMSFKEVVSWLVLELGGRCCRKKVFGMELHFSLSQEHIRWHKNFPVH